MGRVYSGAFVELQILQNNEEMQAKILGLLSTTLPAITQLVSSHDFSQWLLLEYLLIFKSRSKPKVKNLDSQKFHYLYEKINLSFEREDEWLCYNLHWTSGNSSVKKKAVTTRV